MQQTTLNLNTMVFIMNTVSFVTIQIFAVVNCYSLDSVINSNYEILQRTSSNMFCKSAPSSNIMLRCLTEGPSGWVVGYSSEQCLICYFDTNGAEFKLYSGSWESVLWLAQTSKVLPLHFLLQLWK